MKDNNKKKDGTWTRRIKGTKGKEEIEENAVNGSAKWERRASGGGDGKKEGVKGLEPREVKKGLLE